MRNAIHIRATCSAIMAAVLATLAGHAAADIVTDWNQKAGELIIESKVGTPPAIRTMAIVQTAVHGATNAVTQRHTASSLQPEAAPGASVEAAVAAANRGTLSKLLPAQQAAIDAAYQRAVAAIADGPAKAAGIATGEKAAALALAARADDASLPGETYRPHSTPGAYVPTPTPAVPHWQQRKPWLMPTAAQFRPGPPPALASEAWTRAFDEVKALGSKNSTRRDGEQSEIARFWEFSLPSIYYGVVYAVASMPGRNVTDNARLYAMAAQGMDDGMISVFDAKYHYNFWRPVTAIRNADIDGNDATARDAAWTSFVDAPLHPEYPSAHSVLAGVVGTVLREEVGEGTMPLLSTTSPTAKGASRKWTSVDAFMREVGSSRLYAGIHYGFSIDTGLAMGQKIGMLAANRHLGLVPPGLVPAGERRVDRVAARGVQIYACRIESGTAKAQWVFVAPEAELFDAQGGVAGKHYAGPHWEAPDGSKIVGAVKARADADTTGAIPWLLLSARSVGGTGRYAQITSVQRVNTVGGTAPSEGCGPGTVGTTVRVPYTADYVLFSG